MVWADEELVGTDLNFDKRSGIGSDLSIGFNFEAAPDFRFGVQSRFYWLAGPARGVSLNLVLEADVAKSSTGRLRFYFAVGPGIYKFDEIPRPRQLFNTYYLAPHTVSGGGMFLGMGFTRRLRDNVVLFSDVGVHGIARSDAGIETFVPLRVGFRLF